MPDAGCGMDGAAVTGINDATDVIPLAGLRLATDDH